MHTTHKLPQESATCPFNTRAAAAYLGMSLDTLRRWRRNGAGPAFVRMGPQTIRYRLSDLQDFVANRTTDPARG